MKQYIDLVKHVLENGEWSDNRTGIRTIAYPGAQMRFDLAEGFPAITTRRLAWKSVKGEMCGFLRGYTNAADFRALGCKVWDQNANENAQWLANPFRKGTDDLGPIYGAQWRKWEAYKTVPVCNVAVDAHLDESWVFLEHAWNPVLGNCEQGYSIWRKEIDQLGDCVRTILKDPGNRRILFHGWNPAELDAIALPACHLLYQFHPNVNKREMSMSVYIRSNDLGLGAPFNIAESALLLSLIAHLTGYTPRHVIYTIGDAHIYENHLEMLQEQFTREPRALPTLKISDRVRTFPAYKDDPLEQYAEDDVVAWLRLVEPDDFTLEGYNPHEALTAPMAV